MDGPAVVHLNVGTVPIGALCPYVVHFKHRDCLAPPKIMKEKIQYLAVTLFSHKILFLS